MSKNLSLLFIVLLLFLPLIAACGTEDKEKVELKQTFESTTGITVKYPDGWAVREENNEVLIANKSEILDLTGDTALPAGAFAVIITRPVALTDMGLAADASAKDYFTTFGQDMAGEESTLGDVQDTKVGGKDAARVNLNNPKTKSEGFFIGYNVDDTHIIITGAIAYEGELSQYEETALKIIESITYTAPAP